MPAVGPSSDGRASTRTSTRPIDHGTPLPLLSLSINPRVFLIRQQNEEEVMRNVSNSSRAALVQSADKAFLARDKRRDVQH